MVKISAACAFVQRCRRGEAIRGKSCLASNRTRRFCFFQPRLVRSEARHVCPTPRRGDSEKFRIASPRLVEIGEFSSAEARRFGIPGIGARRGEAILASNRGVRGEAGVASPRLENFTSPRLASHRWHLCTHAIQWSHNGPHTHPHRHSTRITAISNTVRSLQQRPPRYPQKEATQIGLH